MNRAFHFSLLAAALLGVVGCGTPAAETPGATEGAGGETPAANGEANPNDGQPAENGEAGASATGAGFELTGENTKIAFVGTHTGDKPDPRNGEFKALAGSITTDADKVTGITVEIDTTSLHTDNEKLTNHLKSPDFFDVREHPKATFQSKELAESGDGEINVVGDLTLLGVTKEISFPATVTVADGKVTLKASFSFDRSEFGMDFGVDKIEKAVALTISVGG